MSRTKITIGREVAKDRIGDSVRPVTVRQGKREESGQVHIRVVSYGAIYGIGECAPGADEFINAAFAAKSPKALAQMLAQPANGAHP